jgi:hypothetical protein
VFIAELLFDDFVSVTLARRGIEADEAHQLRRNGSIWLDNPRPRVPGSRLLVGPTDGGRLLTVVIAPHKSDGGIWLVKTAWDSSRHERKLYLQRR